MGKETPDVSTNPNEIPPNTTVSKTNVPADNSVSSLKKERKKHPGHEYASTCNCARCKVTTKKVISSFLGSLPYNQLLVTFDENTLKVFESKVSLLKEKFKDRDFDTTMNEMVNESVMKYLETL